MEETEAKADVHLPLAVATAGTGLLIPSDSVETTDVLNYIDYERKKFLANQGRVHFLLVISKMVKNVNAFCDTAGIW